MYKKLHSKILLLLAMMLVGASSVKAEMVLSVNNATIGYKSQSGTLDVTAKDFFLKDYKNGYFEWFENAEGQSCNSSYYEDWITLELSDDKSKISFEVKTENPLSVSRTAYFKLVLWNTVNDIIYSDMVSITQEGHRVVSLSPHEVTLPSHKKDVEGTVSVSANFDLVNTYDYSIEFVPISTTWLTASYDKAAKKINYKVEEKNPSYSTPRSVTLKLIVDEDTWSDAVTITQPRNTEGVLAVSPYSNTIEFEPGTGTMDISTTNFSLTDVQSESFSWFTSEGQSSDQSQYDWITLQLSEDKSKIIYTVTGNTSAQSRTAYFKLIFKYQTSAGSGIIYSDMISVTQNPSSKPILTISPSETVLENNAATTGTLTATIYKFPYPDIYHQFRWYTDATGRHEYSNNPGDGPDWIELDCSSDYKTITYSIQENTSNQPRTAYFAYVLTASDNTSSVWSHIVSITQPSYYNPVLVVNPKDNTIDFGPGSGTADIITTDFSLDDVTNCFFEWFDNAEGTPSTSGYNWITLQFDKDKAKINYTVTGNTSNQPRTAYFKLRLQRRNGLPPVYSDMISVTQNYSSSPVLSITPSETILESNAAGITGTLTATTYNYSYVNVDSEIHWIGDEPDWIEVTYNKDSKAITYRTTKDNTSYQPRTASFQLELFDKYYVNENVIYSHTVTITQPGISFIKGDVNGDGKVTVTDVMAVVNIILEHDNTMPYQYDHRAADVNGDSSISIADVMVLVNIILDKDE